MAKAQLGVENLSKCADPLPTQSTGCKNIQCRLKHICLTILQRFCMPSNVWLLHSQPDIWIELNWIWICNFVLWWLSRCNVLLAEKFVACIMQCVLLFTSQSALATLIPAIYQGITTMILQGARSIGLCTQSWVVLPTARLRGIQCVSFQNSWGVPKIHGASPFAKTNTYVIHKSSLQAAQETWLKFIDHNPPFQRAGATGVGKQVFSSPKLALSWTSAVHSTFFLLRLYYIFRAAIKHARPSVLPLLEMLEPFMTTPGLIER